MLSSLYGLVGVGRGWLSQPRPTCGLQSMKEEGERLSTIYMLGFNDSDSTRKLHWLDSSPPLQFPHCVTLGQPPSCPGLQLPFHKEKVDAPGSLKPLFFLLFWKLSRTRTQFNHGQFIVNIREGNGSVAEEVLPRPRAKRMLKKKERGMPSLRESFMAKMERERGSLLTRRASECGLKRKEAFSCLLTQG